MGDMFTIQSPGKAKVLLLLKVRVRLQIGHIQPVLHPPPAPKKLLNMKHGTRNIRSPNSSTTDLFMLNLLYQLISWANKGIRGCTFCSLEALDHHHLQ